MNTTLENSQHHFIVELNSKNIYGSMKCDHEKSDEAFAYNDGRRVWCKALETFNGMSDSLIFYSGERTKLIEVKLREVNGNPPLVHDYAAIGKYIEDENGDVILTVEAGVYEDLTLMLNGENILGIDAEIKPRKVSFPVEVISLDESEVDSSGGCMDMAWDIVGPGVPFKNYK